MYPEDRVLVTYMPSPADFEMVRRENWYRIPQKHAPKGLHAEYYAFYFGSQFASRKWAIHFYASQLGHELVTRRSLVPDQPEHPRADELYYKVQLGPLQPLERPIVSLRWRRVTFLHTTWDRFRDAREINDLLIHGGDYIDRLFAALKERGLELTRDYRIEEPEASYHAPIAIIHGVEPVEIGFDDLPETELELARLVERVVAESAGAVDGT